MAISIQREFRERFKEILSHSLICLDSSRIRSEIFELPDADDSLGPDEEMRLLGVAWLEGAPRSDLVVMTSSLTAYEMALGRERLRGNPGPIAGSLFIESVYLSPAHLKLLWPFIASRLPPLQALASTAALS